MFSAGNIRWGVILGFIGVAVSLFVIDQTGNSRFFLDLLRDPTTAVAELLAPTAETLSDQLNQPATLAEAESQISSLSARLDQLERENEELREMQGEFQLLSALFDYAAETPQNQRILSTVIGRDPSPLFNSIIIDKGTDDGVQVGMPVDSERGLVGQVFRTTADSAMIMLIVDRSSSIPARLSTSRATGLVHGGGRGNSMQMDWIPLEAEVAIGDVVLTSGLVGQFDQGLLVGRFPKGLVIGRVANVVRSEAEILQQATVQSAVDFQDLELVFVITEFPQENLTPFENPLGDQ